MRRPTLVSVFAVRVSPRPWAHSSKMRRTTLPIVAILSFVCSIGNVPLAAVMWNGGISFGGVISFIFAVVRSRHSRAHLEDGAERREGVEQ